MKNKFLVGLVGGLGLTVLSGCAPGAAAAVQANTSYAESEEVAVPPGPPDASIVAEGPVAAPDNISPGAAEVIRLASAGIAEDVIVAYVNNAQTPFELSADQVLYLKDLGISGQVVTAMI